MMMNPIRMNTNPMQKSQTVKIPITMRTKPMTTVPVFIRDHPWHDCPRVLMCISYLMGFSQDKG